MSFMILIPFERDFGEAAVVSSHVNPIASCQNRQTSRHTFNVLRFGFMIHHVGFYTSGLYGLREEACRNLTWRGEKMD
jgi:hypothetical protein